MTSIHINQFKFWKSKRLHIVSTVLDNKINSKSNNVQNRIKNIAIWGSCVSREIFNYTDVANISVYILQNPIHTCFAKQFKINDEP